MLKERLVAIPTALTSTGTKALETMSSSITVASNLESGFADYEDDALLWLHHNTASTIDGYAALDQRERNMAQQFGMPLWRLVVPALEREMSARGMAFVPMDPKLA